MPVRRKTALFMSTFTLDVMISRGAGKLLG
jgi:hypothetical protein